MLNVLALLIPLGFAPLTPTGALGEQSICPGETIRGRALVVAYATGATSAPRPTDVPIKDESQVRLLVDRNHIDRYACERLNQLVASQRTDRPGTLDGLLVTYYFVDGNYYAVALPATPAVQATAPGRFRMRLRWTPVFVTNANFQLLASVAM